MADLTLKLSQSCVNKINIGKKRPFNPLNHRDQVAKRNRASGIPYRGRNGEHHPGKLPPQEQKTCQNCTKTGCQLSLDDKQRLFLSFHSLTYDEQSSVLVAGMNLINPQRRTMNIEESRRQCTIEYSIKINGRRLPVCKSTYMIMFAVSKKRLEVLSRKIRNGEMSPKDQRGKHTNRTNRISEDIRDMVRDHIKSFPTYESHYCRRSGDPLRTYLNPELTITKMYELFLEQQRATDRPECDPWVYSDILKREFQNVRIMRPKADTCDVCDKINVQIKAATSQEQRALLQDQQSTHHLEASMAYNMLQADKAKANTDPNYVVLTVDLQQVIFTPQITSSSSFYLRKLSNYNLCVRDENDGSATMNIWSEHEGKRGSNEISSCIWKYISGRFAPNNGQEQQRTLVIWFDRCCGQNNNNIVLSTLIAAARRGYFRNVEQKFLFTGHSFNSCDRAFALVEKVQKRTAIITPMQILDVVRAACNENPFTPKKMSREEFNDFKTASKKLKLPIEFKVTKHLWYKYTMANETGLFSRTRFDPYEPWQFFDFQATGTRPPLHNFDNHGLLQAYNVLIRISPKKLTDLKKLAEFLETEQKSFYVNLIEEQTITFHNDLYTAEEQQEFYDALGDA